MQNINPENITVGDTVYLKIGNSKPMAVSEIKDNLVKVTVNFKSPSFKTTEWYKISDLTKIDLIICYGLYSLRQYN